MKIVKQRSRLIFTEFTPAERSKIRELVSTVEKTFIFEDDDKQTIYLPTGMEELVRKNFHYVRIADDTRSFVQPRPLKNPPKEYFEPRNQLQKDAISVGLKAIENDNKLALICPPGEGKTFMSIYLATKIGLRTLMVAPTTRVRDQWADSLIKMFGVKESNITVAASAKDIVSSKTDWVVTLQSSLGNIVKNYDLEKIFEKCGFGTKIIDEAHMFFHNIIRVDGSSNMKHNIYVTATFGRSAEEENRLYHQMFGDLDMFQVPDKKPSLFDRKPGDVYGNKPHMNVNMYWMKSHVTKEEAKDVCRTKYGVNIPKYTELIIPSDGTKTLFVKNMIDIIKYANRKTPYGRMLVLVPTIKSVETVANHIREACPKRTVGTMHSYNRPEDNAKVCTLEGPEIIVTTIKSSGTGLDVPDLSRMVVAEPFKSGILAVQVSGRLRRRKDGKETFYHDICDRNVKQLRVWARARADILKRKSKKFTVIDI